MRQSWEELRQHRNRPLEVEEIWLYRQSIGILKELMNGRMYPTTLEGLERAMRVLAK